MGAFISHAMAPSPPSIIRGSSFADDVPPEILISILERLQLVDRVRFGTVCSSFLSAFRAQNSLPTSPKSMPWIFLPEQSTDTTMAFFDIADRKTYKIPQPTTMQHICLGSSDGWLVIVDQVTSLISLLNPITRNQLHLPAIATVGSPPKLLFLEFHKAIVSCKGEGYDTIVLLLTRQPSTWTNSTMLRLRYGDDAWTPFGTRDLYADATFHDGRFYTMRSNEKVEAWDLDAGPTPLMTVIMPVMMSTTRYLVSSEGGILQVCRSCDYSDQVEFRVFKLDLMEEEWAEMESLEDRVLFLNSCCSMSFSSGSLEECQYGGNCIFFDRYTSGKNRETVVFKMEDKNVKRIHFHGSFWNPSPIWIVPRLLK